MKIFLKSAIAAAAMLGAATVVTGSAQAADFSINIGVPNAVGFDYGTGGYCDAYGCPDQYWNYQVWYGPVFYHGEWFRGPVYFRQSWDGNRVFWIRGGWHHDEWRGRRPAWWYQNHYYAGPALGYDFYVGHGFRHDRDRFWHGNDWNRGHGDHRDWNDQNGHDWNGGDHHDDHGDRHGDRNDGNPGSNWNGGPQGGNGGGNNNPHDHGSNGNAFTPNGGPGNGNGQNGGQNGNGPHGQGAGPNGSGPNGPGPNGQNNNGQNNNGQNNNSGQNNNGSGDHHHHHHDDDGHDNGNGH